jgi:hypothetical protein
MLLHNGQVVRATLAGSTWAALETALRQGCPRAGAECEVRRNGEVLLVSPVHGVRMRPGSTACKPSWRRNPPTTPRRIPGSAGSKGRLALVRLCRRAGPLHALLLPRCLQYRP